jgi:hypothetical protein
MMTQSDSFSIVNIKSAACTTVKKWSFKLSEEA